MLKLLTFQLSNQGSPQTELLPRVIRRQWRVGQLQGQTSITCTDIKASGEQLVAIYAKLSPGLKVWKGSLVGRETLEKQMLNNDQLNQTTVNKINILLQLPPRRVVRLCPAATMSCAAGFRGFLLSWHYSSSSVWFLPALLQTETVCWPSFPQNYQALPATQSQWCYWF